MKRLLLAIILSAVHIVAFGQMNDSFSYQAIVHNNKGEIVKGRYLSILLSTLQGDITGDMESINWISSGYGKTVNFLLEIIYMSEEPFILRA